MRHIYIHNMVHYIVRSKFIDGEEWVMTCNYKTGLSLNWIRLKDYLKD